MASCRKFSELRAKMSPERREQNRRATQAMLAELPLQELRRARGLSQETLAHPMETDQGNISKLEQRTDMYISTLRRYIEAMGGSLEKGLYPLVTLDDLLLPALHLLLPLKVVWTQFVPGDAARVRLSRTAVWICRGRLGALLDRLGALLDRLGALLDRLGALLERLEAMFYRLGAWMKHLAAREFHLPLHGFDLAAPENQSARVRSFTRAD